MAWYDWVPVIGSAYKIFFLEYPGQKVSDYTIKDMAQCCGAFPEGASASSFGRKECVRKCKEEIDLQLTQYTAGYHTPTAGAYGGKTVVNAAVGAAVAFTGKQIIAKVAAGAATGAMVGLILAAIDLGLEFVAWYVHTTKMENAAELAKQKCVCPP